VKQPDNADILLARFARQFDYCRESVVHPAPMGTRLGYALRPRSIEV
jgi:S-ribosylhomocysteine lyase LuxS involved in autoinducer biosynthesis